MTVRLYSIDRKPGNEPATALGHEAENVIIGADPPEARMSSRSIVVRLFGTGLTATLATSALGADATRAATGSGTRSAPSRLARTTAKRCSPARRTTR